MLLKYLSQTKWSKQQACWFQVFGKILPTVQNRRFPQFDVTSIYWKRNYKNLEID